MKWKDRHMWKTENVKNHMNELGHDIWHHAPLLGIIREWNKPGPRLWEKWHWKWWDMKCHNKWMSMMNDEEKTVFTKSLCGSFVFVACIGFKFTYIFSIQHFNWWSCCKQQDKTIVNIVLKYTKMSFSFKWKSEWHFIEKTLKRGINGDLQP